MITRHSCNDFMSHVAVNVGQTEIATAITIRQQFVVESQQMKHCRVQVVTSVRFSTAFTPSSS